MVSNVKCGKNKQQQVKEKNKCDHLALFKRQHPVHISKVKGHILLEKIVMYEARQAIKKKRKNENGNKK